MTVTLPYMIGNGLDADGDELNANLQAIVQAINTDLLAKAGGTMSGNIVLGGTPTADAHAVSKGYVDSHIHTTRFLRSSPFTVTTSVSSQAAIPFQAELNDQLGWGTATSTVLTAPSDGVYTLAYEVNLDKEREGVNYIASFWIQAGDGAFALAGDPTNAAAWRYSNGTTVFLRAGDTVALWRRLQSINGSSQSIEIETARLFLTRLVGY